MIGLTDAVDALEAARDLLDARQVTATFDTPDGQVEIIAAAGGPRVYVDHEQVPMRERTT